LILAAGCNPGSRTADVRNGSARIVSTSPALTELVCSVGASDLLIGRTDVCDYPPEIISKVPVTGRFAIPDIEKILTLNTTLLIESFLVNPVQKMSLERNGIQVEHIECSRIMDIPEATRKTGILTGHRVEAEKLASKLEKGLKALADEQNSRKSKPRTLILLDHLTPVTCGTNTFISEMVTLAGGFNIATSLQKEYDTVSFEWILEKKPELILCFYEMQGDPIVYFRNRTGLKNRPAVKNGHIGVPSELNLICRPGPRILEGIAELRNCLENAMLSTPKNE